MKRAHQVFAAVLREFLNFFLQIDGERAQVLFSAKTCLNYLMRKTENSFWVLRIKARWRGAGFWTLKMGKAIQLESLNFSQLTPKNLLFGFRRAWEVQLGNRKWPLCNMWLKTCNFPSWRKLLENWVPGFVVLEMIEK